MNFGKLGRIPKRIKDDLKIIRLTKNWREILATKFSQEPLLKVQLRNGVAISSPVEVNLNFLFHEIWIEEIYLSKGYEINSDETIFDIGANIGVFAFYAATKAENVKVFSYEPFPSNIAYFEQNLADSKHNDVTLHKFAMAGESGERILHLDEAWIKHSLSESSVEANGIAVQCVTLDDALEKIEKCDLLKMDCEGSEYEILFSSSNGTLKKIKKIVGEFHDLDDMKKNGESLKNFLESKGFRIDQFQHFDGNSGLICATNES